MSFDLNKDMQSLIKSLDLMDEKVNKGVTNALEQGAKVVQREQRRLIRPTSPDLPQHIQVSGLTQTKSGKYQIKVGYEPSGFGADDDTSRYYTTFKGIVLEWGRPGKKRGGINKNLHKIGKLQAVPHIRKGWDNKKEEAMKECTALLEEVAKWSK